MKLSVAHTPCLILRAAHPQTFLELIKLYKSVLKRKRKETQEAIDRLENGLNKLHKTQVQAAGFGPTSPGAATLRAGLLAAVQHWASSVRDTSVLECSWPVMCRTPLACPAQGEVDILVEDARKMAVEVEHKVASANVFADQVGVEKEKVAAENESAKVEADKCAEIAKEVSDKQVRPPGAG